VKRGGRAIYASVEQLVPGDILELSIGTYVPADARLLRCDDLTVDESMLTGESVPVEKAVRPVRADAPLRERTNMVFRGTAVTGGSGLAAVVRIGPNTEVGEIQRMIGGNRPPATPMQRQLHEVGTQLAVISGGVCVVVLGVGLLRGFGAIRMVQTAINLAVAAVPEGLTMVATTTLALGMNRMRKRNVLIRRLAAVESLGSVQTFCLDKTGTLTRNEMVVDRVQLGGDRELRVVEGKLQEGEHVVDPAEDRDLRALLEMAVLCNDAEPGSPGEDGDGPKGSPTETALVKLALDAGLDVEGLRADHTRQRTVRRTQETPLMRTLHFRRGRSKLLAVKGQPRALLERCHRCRQGGEVRELTGEVRASIQAENERMAGNALRVLGIACRDGKGTDESDGDGLIWLGLAGIADPIRPGIKELIQVFHRAGVNTTMITGDQSATAYAIARQLELAADEEPLDGLDSGELDKLDRNVLENLVQDIEVFSAVSPAHKLQIVQALQGARVVVAMSGDGVNDGPALHAADVGVAMGGSGTEVARETADVVLEDDDLRTMADAIEQGRTIYNNTR